MSSDKQSSSSSAAAAAAATSQTQENTPAKPVTRSKEKSAVGAGASKSTAFEEHPSSRKREREGSLEPSTQHTPTKITDPVPTKKNRLQDDALAEESESLDSTETEKVGQIRQKVDAMSTKEKSAALASTDTGASQPLPPQQAKTANGEADAEPPATKVPKVDASPPPLEQSTKAQPVIASPPARTQPTFSSFSSKASPFSAVPTSSGSSATSSSKTSFAAFSAKANASTALPAPTSRSLGGIQPSDLGSSIGDRHEAAPVVAPTPSKSILKGPSLGFGAFAGASPLSKAKSPTPTTVTQNSKTADATTSTGTKAEASSTQDADAPTETETETFGQKLLREDQDRTSGNTDETSPAKTLLPDTPDVDAKTGEEDEETIHSIRAKLYTMAADHSWKERGTGTLRVNIPKHTTKRSARIVMRADGILRVILNVQLFKGMKCELAEKFIRIVAVEHNTPVHYAIKVSNPNNAAALMDVLEEYVLA